MYLGICNITSVLCNQENGSTFQTNDVPEETQKRNVLYCIRCQSISSEQNKHGP